MDEAGIHYSNCDSVSVPTEHICFPDDWPQGGGNRVQDPAVLFRARMMAGLNQHEEKWIPRALRSLALNGDHPLKMLFAKDLAPTARGRLNETLLWL
jgi:hypothetical protein